MKGRETSGGQLWDNRGCWFKVDWERGIWALAQRDSTQPQPFPSQGCCLCLLGQWQGWRICGPSDSVGKETSISSSSHEHEALQNKTNLWILFTLLWSAASWRILLVPRALFPVKCGDGYDSSERCAAKKLLFPPQLLTLIVLQCLFWGVLQNQAPKYAPICKNRTSFISKYSHKGFEDVFVVL